MRRHLLWTGMALAVVAAAGACGSGDAGTETGGEAGAGRGGGSGTAADQAVYEGSFTVLESAEHGPQLCAFVATSYPPQCGGPDIVGWDWDQVEGETAEGSVTWGDYHVVGTYANGRFTLTETPGPYEPTPDPGLDAGALDFSPACDQPDVVDAAQGVDEWSSVVLDSSEVVAAWVSGPGGEWDGPFVGNVVVLPGRGPATTDRIRQTYGGALCVVEREAPTEAELMAIQQELQDDGARQHLGQVQSSYPDGRRGAVIATVWLADGPAQDYVRERWGDRVELHGQLRPVD